MRWTDFLRPDLLARWLLCLACIVVTGFAAMPIPYWKRNAERLRERLNRRATGGRP